MRKAKYKMIEDPNPFFREVPELPGVWTNAATLEECRDELQEVVEEWIFFGIKFNNPLPVLE